ncbi:Long-chain-fatty-acid--CoA ligase [Saccharothrix algeriensis]|uniref:GNAT superfamily N-acetyltransferase n=1 Tax=Saccharothrix algeriensis TaxID=173560 RepID=A0A8T8I105_9PSEU|nr:Long-chain-fatty-acid--CoA ligase [Saccharothrix algeriensis]MBM7809885.1 GNAT superfamily N-acetyltransferase [Saccharothrix algeriensis]QTR04140.1 Long-chain-fatty-acid--CoA ligase [Saccharothrix algeriensis]
MIVTSVAERPDLLGPAVELGGVGHEFMRHDRVGGLARARRLAARWPDCFLVVLDGDVPVARAVGVPLVFPEPGREQLPDHGWDGAVLWAAEDALDGRAPTCLAALDVQVAGDRRGQGIAAVALDALRAAARRKRLRRLVIPVRPTSKDRRPRLGMAEFLARRRPDGLSRDPWLRTHERLGARVVKVAPFSMTVVGSLAQWESWTGSPLVDGQNVVRGALAPVLASTASDVGVYVEPNVWVEHTVDDTP